MSKEKVHYNISDDFQLEATLFKPETGGPHPVVVVIHGGGWIYRHGDMEFICEYLAHAGFAALNITYRLAPGAHYPSQVEDVYKAIEWVRQKGESFNLKTDDISIWGYSAGAHLGLLVGLNPQTKIRCIVSGGTPADLTVWPRSFLVHDLLGRDKPFASNEKLWQAASPVYQVVPNSPPVFLYHGAWDLVIKPEQMERMRKALVKSGVKVETYLVPFMGHVAVYLFSQESRKRALEFLKQNHNSEAILQVSNQC